MAKLRDSDGTEVSAGCTISFCYGIPPVGVIAPIVKRGRQLIALTPGHNPSECPVAELMEHVGDFWVLQHDSHVNAWRYHSTPARAQTKKRNERECKAQPNDTL